MLWAHSRLASLCVLVALSTTFASGAQAGDLKVDASACAGLNEARLHALLRVEVQSVLEANPDMPDLEVGVTCSERELLMVVRDPVTDKQLTRAMPAPPANDPERERIVALAASQLFRASWAELTGPPEPEAEAIGAPTGEAPEQRQAVAVVEQTSEKRRGPHELLAHAGVRWRDLKAPLLMNHVALRYAHRLPRSFLAWTKAEAGFGRANRRLGFVNVVDVFAGAGAGWRTRQFGPATLDLELGGGALYQRLAGKGAAAAVDEGVAWAVTGEILASIAVTFHARRLLATVGADVGYMFEGPRGTVGNETVVDPDGVWIGAGLRLGAVFPGRKNAPR